MFNVDLVIIACILLSAGFGFVRGILRSLFSVGIWFAAILITLYFSNRFATVLPIDSVESPLAKASISALFLFFGTLFLGFTMLWTIGKIYPRGKTSLLRRLFGFGFGAIRGVVLITLLVLAANLVPELKQETWWGNSKLLPRFQKVAKSLHKRLPESIGQHFYF